MSRGEMEKTELKRLAVQVDAVIEQIDAGLPAHQAGAVAEFAAQFFAQVDPEDLEKLSVADLYGAVLSQWHFIARRKSGVSTVRCPRGQATTVEPASFSLT